MLEEPRNRTSTCIESLATLADIEWSRLRISDREAVKMIRGYALIDNGLKLIAARLPVVPIQDGFFGFGIGVDGYGLFQRDGEVA